MSHTPGPWFVADVNAPVNINVVAAIGVEWCVHTDAEFGDTEADARLIAAAPDLLAAAEAAVGYLMANYWTIEEIVEKEEETLEILNAAIAKAKDAA